MKSIYSSLNKQFKCPCCNKKHFIPIRFIERDIELNQIPSLIENITDGRTILLLCDELTYKAAGKKLETVFNNSGWNYDTVILKPVKTKRVHAEDKYFKQIISRSNNKSVILTVGTGSITDMGKYIGSKLNIPVISFPTAPSMNAYTSSVTAFMKKGLKVTISSKPPVGVVINKKILAKAPTKLIKSGFADSLAKCYANADWKMNSILTNDYFCPLPLEIVTQSEKGYINKGNLIINRNEKLIDSLMDGLLKGGISMIIAGTSSPASGGEHLISHYLDMEACYRNIEPYSYHGLQVGMGIITVSKIYDRLAKMNKEEIKERLNVYKMDSYRQNLKYIFKDRFKIIWDEFKKKQKTLKKLPVPLIKNWDKIKKEVFPMTHPYKKVKKHLLNAKCPVHFYEIGVNKKLAYNTIMNARFIRNRLTILDIADETGILEEVTKGLLKDE